MAANAEGLEWRQARQYLIQSGVIPPTHRVTKPDVDLVDFARSLRDGVFLCSLLNKMKPNCVEDWSPRPLMQHSYLRNIAAFLQACRKHFNLQDLFVETDLYEVDNFKKVMQVLSQLSHSPEALGMGWVPFPRKEHRNYYNQVANEESIYASLQEVTSSHDRLYANVEELYGANPEEEEDPYSYGNESIYDSICYYQAQPQAGRTTDIDEKKSFILAELFETERNVVRVLHLICHSYHAAVKQVISAEDCRLLFDTAQQLYPVHCGLLEGLERAQEMKHDSSRAVAEVTQHFLSQHSGFLHYGQYAVQLPFAIDKAKVLQTRGETAKAMMTVQQSSAASEKKFPLSDLLNVPIQRVLKYPLLMKELFKCAQKQTAQTEMSSLHTVIDQLEDLAHYINSTKGDAEDMKQIEEVEQSFSEPLATPLLQCGRYRLDGELKVKAPGENGSSKKWVFLFDKVMLVCRKPRAVFDQRYAVKQVYQVAHLRVEPMMPQPRTKGQFGLHIYNGGNLDIDIFTKTEEMKTRWMEAINHAKEVIAPRESNRGNHNFELTTFEEACVCDVCGKLLCGCYFQGYYCQGCRKSAHYSCLGSVRACNSMHPPALPPSRHAPLAPRLSLQGTDHPPLSPRNAVPRRGTSLHEPDMHAGAMGHGTVFVAKQRYDAIGHRQSRILTFDRGEELEVVNPVQGSEWWEATSLRTGKQGEVPSSYLSRKQEELHPEQMREEERIKTFTWFIGKMSRIEAEQCLHRMKDGVFLIRESDARQGEYAIALRWKRMPKHIKICKHPDTKRFYVSDVTDFESVWDLVSYYQANSLGTSFPGVDTTLRISYKDIEFRSRGASNPPAPPPLPPSRSHQPLSSPLPHQEKELWAEVLFNFSSEYPDEMSIEKHEHVQVLDKQTDKPGWWYGQCSDRIGLFPSNYVREIS